MNHLIFLIGEIDSSFFLNEIETLTQKFDKVTVLSYKGDKIRCDEISTLYNFEYKFINLKERPFKTLTTFMRWLNYKHVQEELKTQLIGLKGLKKFAYICWYGLFASRIKIILESYVSESDSSIYLYSYWLSRLAYSIALLNLERNCKIKKIVSRAHRYDLYEERNPMNYLPFRKFLDENLDEIYFIAKNGKDYFLKQNYTYQSNVSLKKVFYLGTFNKQNLKKKITNKNIMVIASCSNVIEVKRIDLIIRFLQQFGQKEVRWIHIGDGSLMSQMKDMALKSLNIEYEFLGKIDNTKILNIYLENEVDFLINLSDSEGIPVSIMEALSVGIPVIARNVGGISEIITSGYNGVLLNAQKTDVSYLADIAKTVLEIYNNPEKYLLLSKQANSSWQNSFNADINYKNFAEDLLY